MISSSNASEVRSQVMAGPNQIVSEPRRLAESDEDHATARKTRMGSCV